MRVLLPVFTVEGFNYHFLRLGVKASNIDIITIGIRTRNIERFYAAYLAKPVFGLARVEGVGC